MVFGTKCSGFEILGQIEIIDGDMKNREYLELVFKTSDLKLCVQ